MATSQFLIPTQHRNFGANEKALKIRMKSVNSIKKITKAMKMVATSKMKGDLRRLAAGKEFGVGSLDTLFESDTYMKERQPPVGQGVELLVPISSDKGMCGSLNSGIVRDLRDYVSKADRSKVAIMSIGDKGTVGCRRPMKDLLRVGISEVSTPYNFPTAMALGQNIVNMSEEVEADRITVFYNEFVSAIKTNIIHLELMTRQRFIASFRPMFLYNMNKPSGVPALYDLYVSSNLWVCLLNNAASE